MRTWVVVGVLLALVAGLVGQMLPAAAATPPDERAFFRVWERTDALVADGAVERTWYWGPEPLFTFDEEYKQGVEGQRRVQYWDKGRMEISNPNDNPDDAWYVTSGLLPIEMIAGRIQMGDTSFERRDPTQLPVAGDPDAQSNADAPTYADFAQVTTVSLDSRLSPITMDPIGPIAADNAAPPLFGNLVSAALTGDGQIEQRPDLAAAYPGTRLVYYDGTLSHNIPQVFWDFLQQVGPVQINGEQRQDLLVDWLYLIGHPASEPYWITTNIDGVPQDLMVQVYERRVLTFNPNNPPGWQVEMSNTGWHYYLWRYELTSPPEPPNFARPNNINASVEPPEATAGTTFRVTLSGFDPGEQVSVWLTMPDDSVLEAPEPAIADDNGNAALFGEMPIQIFSDEDSPIGVWALTGAGASSGNTAVAYFTVFPPEE